MVRVEQIVENGAYVTLLEYDGIEGMITPNEYTKVKSIKKASSLKIGAQSYQGRKDRSGLGA